MQKRSHSMNFKPSLDVARFIQVIRPLGSIIQWLNYLMLCFPHVLQLFGNLRRKNQMIKTLSYWYLWYVPTILLSFLLSISLLPLCQCHQHQSRLQKYKSLFPKWRASTLSAMSELFIEILVHVKRYRRRLEFSSSDCFESWVTLFHKAIHTNTR